MRVKLRKASLYSQLLGLSFLIAGNVPGALATRLVTEALRVPTHIHERKRDQVWLSLVVAIGCVIGIVRYS